MPSLSEIHGLIVHLPLLAVPVLALLVALERLGRGGDLVPRTQPWVLAAGAGRRGRRRAQRAARARRRPADAPRQHRQAGLDPPRARRRPRSRSCCSGWIWWWRGSRDATPTPFGVRAASRRSRSCSPSASGTSAAGWSMRRGSASMPVGSSRRPRAVPHRSPRASPRTPTRWRSASRPTRRGSAAARATAWRPRAAVLRLSQVASSSSRSAGAHGNGALPGQCRHRPDVPGRRRLAEDARGPPGRERRLMNRRMRDHSRLSGTAAYLCSMTDVRATATSRPLDSRRPTPERRAAHCPAGSPLWLAGGARRRQRRC